MMEGRKRLARYRMLKEIANWTNRIRPASTDMPAGLDPLRLSLSAAQIDTLDELLKLKMVRRTRYEGKAYQPTRYIWTIRPAGAVELAELEERYDPA